MLGIAHEVDLVLLASSRSINEANPQCYSFHSLKQDTIYSPFNVSGSFSPLDTSSYNFLRTKRTNDTTINELLKE
jgi:hypothetical protein